MWKVMEKSEIKQGEGGVKQATDIDKWPAHKADGGIAAGCLITRLVICK